MKHLQTSALMLSGSVLFWGLGCSGSESFEHEGAAANDAKPAEQAKAASQDIEAEEIVPNEPTALAELEVEDGHTIAFYELEPGSVAIVERMTGEQAAVVPTQGDVDALEVYREFSDDATVPTALADAYARAQAAELAEEPAELAQAASGGGELETVLTEQVQTNGQFGVSRQAISSSSNPSLFVNTNGGCDWGSRFSACRITWSGGFFAQATASSFTCTVDHYAGNGVLMRMTVNGVNNDFSLPVGAAFQITLSGSSVLRRLDVLNAAGDSFHSGCRFTI